LSEWHGLRQQALFLSKSSKYQLDLRVQHLCKHLCSLQATCCEMQAAGPLACMQFCVHSAARWEFTWCRKRVVVIDTSNEIAGDAPTPHACIGRARRMMVPDRASQHAVMIEAVQNHTPQVLPCPAAPV